MVDFMVKDIMEEGWGGRRELCNMVIFLRINDNDM
jgi:hypothetical protein